VILDHGGANPAERSMIFNILNLSLIVIAVDKAKQVAH
jgi:hypothetical protein